MAASVFIEGEPVLSGGRGQDEWQQQVATAVPQLVTFPDLTSVVSGLRRRGHPFDLDNLVHPVLAVLEEPVDYVRARLFVGRRPGLLVRDVASPVPSHRVIRSLYIASHSMVSSVDRTPIHEIADDPVLDEHEGLGISLEFDASTIPIRRGWFGPTEAVIDDLTPWLGTYTARHLIADHRVRDLRILRGVDPERTGVRIDAWYVPDNEVELSDSRAHEIFGATNGLDITN